MLLEVDLCACIKSILLDFFLYNNKKRAFKQFYHAYIGMIVKTLSVYLEKSEQGNPIKSHPLLVALSLSPSSMPSYERRVILLKKNENNRLCMQEKRK